MGTTRRILLGAAGSLLAAPALAAWPERAIRIIVPFTAGGNTDVIIRLLLDPMRARLGQPLVVENRAGGNGTPGAEAAARSPADGYTLFAGSGGTLSANPVLQAQLPYDPVRDFAPIGLVARSPLVLVVGPRAPFATLDEFLSRARAAPGSVSLATPGIGTTAHLALELLQRAAEMQLLHVPYRGGGALVGDLIAGTFDASLLEVTTALPLHREGRARILAVADGARLPDLPDVPSFIERGVASFTSTSFTALLAPARTPPEIIAALRDALGVALRDPTVRARIAGLGAVVATEEQATPAALAAFLAAELAQYRRAAELAGIRPQ
ncbi:MAG TPA: tripartite tricarboxylate transporter substrate binding protein [Acetobacteraceae bacterium]|nr:tripartite tricarboxylate transporter substrate binding protein [Acetobacteraceae bacterium]